MSDAPISTPESGVEEAQQFTNNATLMKSPSQRLDQVTLHRTMYYYVFFHQPCNIFFFFFHFIFLFIYFFLLIFFNRMSVHQRHFAQFFLHYELIFSSHTMFINASTKEFTPIHLVTFGISHSGIRLKF